MPQDVRPNDNLIRMPSLHDIPRFFVSKMQIALRRDVHDLHQSSPSELPESPMLRLQRIVFDMYNTKSPTSYRCSHNPLSCAATLFA